jgi:uncharacterized membrane protein YbhN (UPF0104 family)
VKRFLTIVQASASTLAVSTAVLFFGISVIKDKEFIAYSYWPKVVILIAVAAALLSFFALGISKVSDKNRK